MNRGRKLLNFADRAVALLFVPISASRRFRFAWLLARTLGSLLRFAPALADRTIYLDSGEAVYALRVLLRSLRRSGLPFVVPLEAIGVNALVEANAAGRPVLVASAHQSLVGFIANALDDAGLRPAVVMTEVKGEERILGRETSMHVISYSANVLVAIRSAIRKGEVPFIVIDSRVPFPGWTAIPTRAGTRYVGNSLFKLAWHCKAELFFATTSMHDGSVGIEFERIGGDSPEGLAAAAAAKVAAVGR